MHYVSSQHYLLHIVADFGLSENDYRANEFELSIPVKISITSGITLANPVQMRITPMTFGRALELNIITLDIVGVDNMRNPNRASEWQATYYKS